MHADEGLGRAARRLTRIPPINPSTPLLSKDDYFTIPDIKRMRRFSDEELKVGACLPSQKQPCSCMPCADCRFELHAGERTEKRKAHAHMRNANKQCGEPFERGLVPLQAVDRLVIGRKDVGEVAFIGPVDLWGLVLDDIVDIDKGKIQVYGLPGGAQRPAVGQGLNKPALLSFRCDML